MNNSTAPQEKVKQGAPPQPVPLDKFYKHVLKGFGYDYQRSTPRG
jgi:hypothetical protein